ncbi:Major facilitator family transporter [Mycobacteroides abscessus]|nr:Major facilitator family transporter [Mycobacteroides abscessus]
MMLTMLGDASPLLTHPVLLCGGALLATVCLVVLMLNSRTGIGERPGTTAATPAEEMCEPVLR